MLQRLPHDREGRADRRHACCCSAKPAPARRCSRARCTTCRRAATSRFVAINCAAIPGEPARKRAVRLREGRLHRRREADARQDRDRQRRHAVARRDRRPAAGAAGQAAALPAGARDRARRRTRRRSPVDVRIVCATHQDLQGADRARARSARTCTTGSPRSSSTSRRCARGSGDAALLAHAFVRRFAAEQRRGVDDAARRGAIAAIEAHAWPGNVRELRERASSARVIMADGDAIARGRLRARRTARTSDAAQPAAGARRGRARRGPARAGARQRQPEQGGRDARGQPADALRPDAPLRSKGSKSMKAGSKPMKAASQPMKASRTVLPWRSPR